MPSTRRLLLFASTALLLLAGESASRAAAGDAVVLENYRQLGEAELCNGEGRGSFTGTLELRRKDGSLMRRLACIDGKKDGIDRQFYKNGTLAMERNWREGALDGLYRHWFEDGTLKERWTYGPHGLDGAYYVFHANGQIASKAHWREGKRHGPYANYDREGRLKETGNYDAGRADGDVVEYKSSGGISYEHYLRGTPVGMQTLVGSEGTVLARAQYDDAGRFVRSQVWQHDGTPIRIYEPIEIEGFGRGLRTVEYTRCCEKRTVIQSGTDDPRDLARIGYSLTPGLYRLETIEKCGKLVERVEAFDHELLAEPIHADPPEGC